MKSSAILHNFPFFNHFSKLKIMRNNLLRFFNLLGQKGTFLDHLNFLERLLQVHFSYLKAYDISDPFDCIRFKRVGFYFFCLFFLQSNLICSILTIHLCDDEMCGKSSSTCIVKFFRTYTSKIEDDPNPNIVKLNPRLRTSNEMLCCYFCWQKN